MRIERRTLRFRRLVVLAATVLGAATGLAAVPATAASPGGYRAVVLDVEGSATDVNDSRQLVGEFLNGDRKWHPFLWQHGRLTDLGVLRSGSGEVGTARAVNNRGQVVGESAVRWGGEDVNLHAFLWERGVMTDLGTLGGEDSTATAINDRGQVFGTSSVAPGVNHAFRWEDGVMTDLGEFRVWDANNRGQVAGTGPLADDRYGGLLWDRGRVVDIGFGHASAINDAGWVVGYGYDETMTDHAYLWRSGVVTDLGMPGPGTRAADVNDRGVILVARDSGLFLWRAGRLTDLTRRGVPGGWPGVEALNNRGDLAGSVNTGDGVPGHPVLYVR